MIQIASANRTSNRAVLKVKLYWYRHFCIQLRPLFYLLYIIWLVACSKEKETVLLPEDSTTISDCYAVENHTLEEYTGWTWLNVTVGSSTRQELIAEFGQPNSIHSWPPQEEKPLACLYSYSQNETYLTFWVVEDRVAGIGFSKAGGEFQVGNLPNTVYEAEELYGHPDLVGWSSGYIGYRTVVWANKGVLAIAFASGPAGIANLYFFMPMTTSKFNESFWSRTISFSPPEDTDYVDGLPQDPFDWKD